MLLMLLACAGAEIDRLDAEVLNLQAELDALEEQVEAIEEDEWDTGETAEPQPGEIEIGFQSLGAPYWQADISFSEEAYGALIVTAGAAEGVITSPTWTNDCFTAAWSYDGPTDELLLVVEVEWASGAWSCVQLVGPDVKPVTGCDVVQAHPVSCA